MGTSADGEVTRVVELSSKFKIKFKINLTTKGMPRYAFAFQLI